MIFLFLITALGSLGIGWFIGHEQGWKACSSFYRRNMVAVMSNHQTMAMLKAMAEEIGKDIERIKRGEHDPKA